MLSLVHQFYAMGSDCALHLYGGTASGIERLAVAAEQEIRRIEARYSRYRSDSELAGINRVAATGAVIDIDAVLPFIDLDDVILANGQLHFRRPGMKLDLGG